MSHTRFVGLAEAVGILRRHPGWLLGLGLVDFLPYALTRPLLAGASREMLTLAVYGAKFLISGPVLVALAYVAHADQTGRPISAGAVARAATRPAAVLLAAGYTFLILLGTGCTVIGAVLMAAYLAFVPTGAAVGASFARCTSLAYGAPNTTTFRRLAGMVSLTFAVMLLGKAAPMYPDLLLRLFSTGEVLPAPSEVRWLAVAAGALVAIPAYVLQQCAAVVLALEAAGSEDLGPRAGAEVASPADAS